MDTDQSRGKELSAMIRTLMDERNKFARDRELLAETLEQTLRRLEEETTGNYVKLSWGWRLLAEIFPDRYKVPERFNLPPERFNLPP